MSTTILRCERRIVVLISLLHAQQDALTQYKDKQYTITNRPKYMLLI
jgi:hypothetical protein